MMHGQQNIVSHKGFLPVLVLELISKENKISAIFQ
jgi:hypothetical protein